MNKANEQWTSSRPLGWCRQGADKMARLRVYAKNGGSMLELVRYQKKKLPKVSGYEEVIYCIPYPQIKKIAALKDHIWGL